MIVVPKRGLEPPRLSALVPETSASTNSATWASQETASIAFLDQQKTVNEKNSLLAEFEGVVSGHRDGHGFVVRDDGQADIYLPSNEMRAVLHKDRVKARIVRLDRKGRPEGRVTEIVERSDAPIIGRLLQESGVWLVAPEDKRYGQDVLIPKGATGSAKPGQVVVVELTEPPALYGQPVGRVKEVLGEITTRAWRSKSRCANTVCRTSSRTQPWRRRVPCLTMCDLWTTSTGSICAMCRW